MRRTARKAKRPSRVSEVLEGYLRKAGLGERLEQARIVADWPKLVGSRIARVAHAEAVREDGVLLVRVSTAPWLQELSLMTPQIIARVNAGRGEGRIAGIRWLLAERAAGRGRDGADD